MTDLQSSSLPRSTIRLAGDNEQALHVSDKTRIRTGIADLSTEAVTAKGHGFRSQISLHVLDPSTLRPFDPSTSDKQMVHPHVVGPSDLRSTLLSSPRDLLSREGSPFGLARVRTVHENCHEAGPSHGRRDRRTDSAWPCGKNKVEF